MEVYRRGPKSGSKVDYTVIINNDVVRWYKKDGTTSCADRGATTPEKWVFDGVWKTVDVLPHVKVALRLLDNPSKNMYQFVTNNLRRKQMSTKNRGFAGMTDRNRQREIASKGGKAAHRLKVAHEWTSEEAREAGRKGGLASQKARASRSVSVNPLVSGEL